VVDTATAVLEQAGALRACLFSLAGESFAVDVRTAREVIVVEDHTPVPGAPPSVIGVANLRGAVVPIVDVRSLLGLAGGGRGGETRALVVDADGFQVAIAIETVLGLESFEAVLPFGDVARKRFEDFGQGLLPRGAGLATLLDVPNILHALRAAWADKEGRA
jgi:purine-binding chemotaxis protein CheW